MKNLENTIVVRNEEGEMFMTSKENFETQNLCECFGNYGHKNDCYDSGCYSLDNSACEMHNDLLRYIDKKMNTTYFTDLESCSFDSIDEFISLFDDEKNIDAIKVLAEEWVKENTNHTEVEAWTYWNGSNHETLVLESDSGMNDVTELDDDEQEKIISEYQGMPHIEGTHSSEETENYIFSFSRMANDPWICSIRTK